MYKLIYLERRNPNVTREEWPETWRSHSAFAGQFSTHNSPLHRSLPHFPFDAISECWFESVECAVRALKNGELGTIERDLREFCDLERGVTMLCNVCNRWPP